MPEAALKGGEIQEGKVWFHRRAGVLTLGLTSAGIETLGELTEIEFPEPGEDIAAGEVVVTVDGNQGRVEVLAPAAGTIEEVNEAAKTEPDVVSEDPLEEGWLVRIQIEDEVEESEDESEEEESEEESDAESRE